jgi:hypothetical protein
LLRKTYFLNANNKSNKSITSNTASNTKIKSPTSMCLLKSSSHSFSKNDSSFNSQSAFNSFGVSQQQLHIPGLKFMNETVQTESNDEAESLMNIYIASNLNENTFHMEPNEANFFSEQFEYQNKNKVNG